MIAALTEAPVLELEDSWEAINEWFLTHDLTDGLPIVPPTQARVAAMTGHVERVLGWKAADVIGTGIYRPGAFGTGPLRQDRERGGYRQSVTFRNAAPVHVFSPSLILFIQVPLRAFSVPVKRVLKRRMLSAKRDRVSSGGAVCGDGTHH